MTLTTEYVGVSRATVSVGVRFLGLKYEGWDLRSAKMLEVDNETRAHLLIREILGFQANEIGGFPLLRAADYPGSHW